MGLTERSFLERMELMGFMPTRTNADSFRSMSDEELAEAFVKIEKSGAIHQGPRSKQKWLDWLKSSAEVDDG